MSGAMWQEWAELGQPKRQHPALFGNYGAAIHIELAAEGVAKSVLSCEVVIPEALRGIFDGPRSLQLSFTGAIPRQVLTSSDLLTQDQGPVVFSSTPAASSCAAEVAEELKPIALDADTTSNHSDLAAASQSTSMRSFFCVPIFQEIQSAGASTSGYVEIETRCLGALTVGFPSSAAATKRDLESSLLLASTLSELHGDSLAILAYRLASLAARDAHPFWGTAGGLLLPHAEDLEEYNANDDGDNAHTSSGNTSTSISTPGEAGPGVSQGPQLQTISGWRLSFSSPAVLFAYEQWQARQRKWKDPIALVFLLLIQASGIFFSLPPGSYSMLFFNSHEMVPAAALLALLGLLATKRGRRIYSRQPGGLSGAAFLAAVWQCVSRGHASLGAKSASRVLSFLSLRPTFLWTALVGVALQVWPPLMLSVLTIETLKMDALVQCPSLSLRSITLHMIKCWGLAAVPVAVVAVVAYLLERRARLLFCAGALGATWAWYKE